MEKKFGQKSFNRFKKGNIRDFELLYLTHYSFVKLYTVCLPDSDPQKEIIIDDGFFKVWEKRKMFRDILHVEKYLRVMTMRACHSYFRDYVTEKDTVKEKNHLSGSTGEGATPNEDGLQKLYMHLTGLSIINRLIIRLSFGEKKPNVEIARMLNVSANNIAIRKHRIFKALKTQMGLPGLG